MTLRPLTSGETRLAQSVFGSSIDYSKVNISDSQCMPLQPHGTAMAPDGNIYMYGCYRSDYSMENPEMRSHFIHEMTHVWQFQNKVLHPVIAAAKLSLKHKFNYSDAYSFHLDEKKDLTSYGMEQQASIIQEYFLNKREGYRAYTHRCQNECGADEKIRLYEKVLEKFLADPAYARRDHFPRPFHIRRRKP